MTLIFCYLHQNGLMLLGDSGFLWEGHPGLHTGALKVQKSPNPTIAAALWGDLGLPTKDSNQHFQYHRPDLWLQQFLAAEVTKETSLDDAVGALKKCLVDPSLNPKKSNGGFLIAGFRDRSAVVHQIKCESVSDTDPTFCLKPSVFTEQDMRAAPIVRGLNLENWGQFEARIGRPASQNREDLKALFTMVVKTWQNNKIPVSEPIMEAFIEPDPFHRPDLQSPIPGSLKP